MLLSGVDPSPIPGTVFRTSFIPKILSGGGQGSFFALIKMQWTRPPARCLRCPVRRSVDDPADRARQHAADFDAPGTDGGTNECFLPGNALRGIVRLDNPNTDDPVLVLDGVPVVVQGKPRTTSQPVDPASGSNDVWHRIYDGHVTESGSWMMEGRITGNGPNRYAIMRDGEVVLREGDVVDGHTLVSQPYDLRFGANGQEICIWHTTVGQGSVRRTLLVDRKPVLRIGDLVDEDGDGVVDPGWSVSQLNFSAGNLTDTLDMDEDGVVRIEASVLDETVPFPTNRIAILELRMPLGVPTCQALANSAGPGATLRGAGTLLVARNAFELIAEGAPPGQFAYFLNATSPQLPLPGGVAGQPLSWRCDRAYELVAGTGLRHGALSARAGPQCVGAPHGPGRGAGGRDVVLPVLVPGCGRGAGFSEGLRVVFR